MTRNILIIIIVAAVLFAVLLVFFLLFRQEGGDQSAPNIADLNGSPNSPSMTNQAESNQAVGLATTPPWPNEIGSDTLASVSEDAAADQLLPFQRLINTKIIGAALTETGDRLQYYDAMEGSLASVSFLGADPLILGMPADPISNIIWSPDRQKLLYQAGGENFFYSRRDLLNPVNLGDKVQQPVFSDDSRQIIYQYFDPAGNKSNISIGLPHLGLSDYRVLTQMKGRVWSKRVPGQNKVAYYLSPQSNRPSGIEAVDVASGQFEILANEGLGTDATWNDDGTRMIFTKLDRARNLALFLAGGDGRNAQLLPKATFIDKATWDPNGRFIYIAVPQPLPNWTQFYQEKTRTEDVLYQIDLETNEATLVYNFHLGVNSSPIDARNLFTSPQGKLLFFVNAYDESLYVVNLKKVHEAMAIGAPVFNP